MNLINSQTRKMICLILQEPSFPFRRKVEFIIERCGYKFASNILGQALKLEVEGGTLTADGSRRRTIGGTFMRLANEQMTVEQRHEVYRLLKRKIPVDKPMSQVDAEMMAELLGEPEIAAEVVAEPILEREAVELEIVNAPAPQAAAEKPSAQKQKNGKAAAKSAVKRKQNLNTLRQARFEEPFEAASSLPDNLPPAVKAKLQQLQGAANVLRERVQQLEDKPAGQQVGLELARKLLTNTEGQIDALLAEHERSGEVISP